MDAQQDLVSPNLDMSLRIKNPAALKKNVFIKVLLIALQAVCDFSSYLIDMSTQDPVREEAALAGADFIRQAVTEANSHIGHVDNLRRLFALQSNQRVISPPPQA